MYDEPIHQAIMDAFTSEDDYTDRTNVVDALFDIARQLRKLGLNDTATHMGAIEALGKAVLDTGERIAMSLDNLADAVRESRRG